MERTRWLFERVTTVEALSELLVELKPTLLFQSEKFYKALQTDGIKKKIIFKQYDFIYILYFFIIS